MQKKRYSDGYYYYGIVKKTLVKENKKEKELRNITDIIEERNNLFGEMTGEGFYKLI